MNSVKLRPASCWRCPSCKRMNFFRTKWRKATADEAQAIAVAYGEVEEWQDFSELRPHLETAVAQVPDEVVCKKCGTVFDVDCDDCEVPPGIIEE